MDGSTVDGKVQTTAGGVGRNVADCMARLGANPFFMSVVGAQEYAQTLIAKMSHMDTKGIKIIQDARTATCVVVLDQNGECVFMVGDMSVHGCLSPEQVENHSDIIARAPMVVIDSNIAPSTMNCVINLCSKHQVPVWFEPTDISLATRPFEGSVWRSAIAYASPNLNELRMMHDKIFAKATPPLQDACLERKLEESLRLGIPLLTDALHTLVVTLASHGVLLITTVAPDCPFPAKNASQKVGNVRAIHYPARIPESIISVSGAGDCFAAAMITAILQGCDTEECISAGQLAATISLSSHHAVPEHMHTGVVFDNTTLPTKKPLTVL